MSCGHPPKRTALPGDLPLESSVGLEIGPRDSPLVPKSRGRISYVDYAATDVIRANATRNGIDPSSVVEVDIIWGERPLRDCIDEPVDYIVASHVLEHVPDLIGWLSELHDALKPEGTPGLAVPDRRFTFDVLRRESSLAELVEAYVLRYRQPSVRQVFEAASLSIAVDAEAVWRGEPLDPVTIDTVRAGLPGMLAFAQYLAANPHYFDAHCWVFTPASFLDVMEQLAWLQLFPFVIDAFFPTAVGALEFQIRLRAVGSDRTAETLASIAAARKQLVDTSPVPTRREIVTETGSRNEWESRAAELEFLAAELRAQKQFLEESFLSSTSWRVTTPLRAASRLVTAVATWFGAVMNSVGAWLGLWAR